MEIMDKLKTEKSGHYFSETGYFSLVIFSETNIFLRSAVVETPIRRANILLIHFLPGISGLGWKISIRLLMGLFFNMDVWVFRRYKLTIEEGGWKLVRVLWRSWVVRTSLKAEWSLALMPLWELVVISLGAGFSLLYDVHVLVFLCLLRYRIMLAWNYSRVIITIDIIED